MTVFKAEIPPYRELLAFYDYQIYFLKRVAMTTPSCCQQEGVFYYPPSPRNMNSS